MSTLVLPVAPSSDEKAALNHVESECLMSGEFRSVFDVLDDVRFRRDWLGKGGTLDGMVSFLSGYSIALKIHVADEDFDLDPVGAFTNWLSWNFGTGLSAGWASAVERLTHDGESSLQAFFRLVDAFRSGSLTEH